MNTYPADHSRIENNISTGTYDIENPNNYACQGFPSIDYMIHGIDNDKEKIILKYRENEKYGEYLQHLLIHMKILQLLCLICLQMILFIILKRV